MADPTTERKELLERIWMAEAQAFVKLLEDTPADQLSAAVLAQARNFLGDNGVRLDTLKADQKGMSADLVGQIAEAVREEPLPPPD